jgi:1-acyl-sn-glycerol-3-phosphate acyltransferase
MWSMKWPSPGRLSQVAYGVAAWLMMGAVGVPCWLLVLALPKLSWRWRATWGAVRLLCLGLGISVEVRGELPTRQTPCIIVANHASILDSFVFCAVFAEPVVFVAGGDLARQKITGPFLRRLGCVFVRAEEGAGPSSVRAALAELAAVARAGERLVFFPEGGLSPDPGVRRFQLGAFVVASQVGRPVVPLAILGTRQILPPNARLPRHCDVEVRVGHALTSTGNGFAAARDVAGQARSAIEALLSGRAP